jgi:hypothetical protein
MEFLRLFKTKSEYEEEKASGLTLPNVSHCIKEEEHYMSQLGVITPLGWELETIT